MTEALAGENADQVKINAGAYAGMNNGDFAFYLADIFVESVQYGGRTVLCNLMSNISNNTFEEKLKAIADHAKNVGVAPSDYCRNALKNTTLTLGSGRQWTYQYCTQFGWY